MHINASQLRNVVRHLAAFVCALHARVEPYKKALERFQSGAIHRSNQITPRQQRPVCSANGQVGVVEVVTRVVHHAGAQLVAIPVSDQ